MLRKLTLNDGFHRTVRITAYLLAGFCFSAAGLANAPMTLAMGLVCACSVWSAVLTALGAVVGYRLFWGGAGYIGAFCVAASLPITLLLSDKRLSRRTPLLLPMLAATIAAMKSHCELSQTMFGLNPLWRQRSMSGSRMEKS